MSSTLPSLKTRSTSSTASKRNLKRPEKSISTSRRRVSKPSSEDELVVRSFESVWDALESDPGERERMKMLSHLLTMCRERIKAEGWTQRETAKRLGVTQPRVSDLVRGRISVFSIDALVGFLGKLGAHLEIRYRET